MAPVYTTRSSAIIAATRKGLTAFQTFKPQPDLIKDCWTFEERPDGPGIQYAKLFAEGKDWIFAVEIGEDKVPRLIVSCFREEIIEEIPELFKIEPLTPELWEANRREYPDTNYRKYRLQKPSLVPQQINGSAGGTQTTPAPVATGSQPVATGSHKRMPGATGICRELMAANPAFATDKAGFMAACMARGVIAVTASTQWYRLRGG